MAEEDSRTSDEARHSDVDFRKIFRTTPERHLLIDADPPRFTVLAASNPYLDLVDKRRDELVGRGVFEIFPDTPTNDQHLLREALARAVRTGERQSLAAYRYDLASRDDDEQPVERYWSPVLTPFFDDGGDVETVLLRVEDATDVVLRSRYTHDRHPDIQRKERGTVLVIEPDAEQRAFLAAALDTHWEVQSATTADEGLEILRDHSPNVVLTAARFADQPGLEFISTLAETAPSTPVVARVAQTDGRRLEEAFEAGADDVVSSPASAREFMARVQTQFAESTLREATHERVRRQYHRLFEQAPVGIALMEGPDKVFTLSNPTYDEIVGNRELIGLPLREAFPEDDLQPFFDNLDDVYETGEPFFANEVPAPTKQTDPTPYLTFAYLPHRDPRGDIRGVAVFAYEVTEQVEMRRAVELENERKDIFMAMLGHELRNPLTPIAHATELLRNHRDEIDPGLLESTTDTIQRQVEQLEHHVDRLLDLARIERGRLDIAPEPTSLTPIVTGAVETVEADIEKRNQTLDVSTPDRPVTVEVDAARITQAVTNLLDNASRHSPADSHIALNAELREVDDETRLVFEVRDQGEGLDPELLPELFEPFTQVEVELDRSRGGLGLGLTLVKRIVDRHGGTVSLTDDSSDFATCFAIELPTEVSEPAGSTESTQPSASNGEFRVLLVDDNPDVLRALELQLEDRGLTTYTANDGHEALEMVDRHHPTHILLDLGLPDIDGHETARRIRRRHPDLDICIAAFTGYGGDDHVERSRQAGFDRHFTKPATPREVVDFLSRHGSESDR